MKMHLAQLNVGRLVAPTDDPRVKEFMDTLDMINVKRVAGDDERQARRQRDGDADEAFGWDWLRAARMHKTHGCRPAVA